MKRFLIASVMILGSVVPLAYVAAHCQVPCGIYDDDRRFSELLEDKTTIAKAIDSIKEISGALADNQDPLTINQLTRWVTTKEDHATNVQRVIADYFMAQRIKPDDPKYVAKLTAAHQVIVAAMKCKQDADSSTATALEQAIKKFQSAYSG